MRVQTWNRKPELCQAVRALQLIYTTIKDPLGIYIYIYILYKNAHTPYDPVKMYPNFPKILPKNMITPLRIFKLIYQFMNSFKKVNITIFVYI